MAALAAVTLHWPQLRSWAATVNPNWVVACFALLLMTVGLTPFMGQQSSHDNKGIEAQKSTLIEWLQQAQRERDEAAKRLVAAEHQIGTATAGAPSQAANPPDHALEATRALAPADRERLAAALYDTAQLLDRAVKLSDDASREVFQIGTDLATPDNPISSERLEVHRQRLASFLDTSRLYWKDLDAMTDKWKYYDTQISYVVGDKPGEKARSLRDMIDSYIHYFDAWSKIKNIEERGPRALIVYQQYPFSVAMAEIRMWGQQSDRRLQEVKNAMQSR